MKTVPAMPWRAIELWCHRGRVFGGTFLDTRSIVRVGGSMDSTPTGITSIALGRPGGTRDSIQHQP